MRVRDEAEVLARNGLGGEKRVSPPSFSGHAQRQLERGVPRGGSVPTDVANPTELHSRFPRPQSSPPPHCASLRSPLPALRPHEPPPPPSSIGTSLPLLDGGRSPKSTALAGGERGVAPPALTSAFDSFYKAARLLVANERVLLLGLVQSCFEGAMYIFVFMWTPALEASLRLSSTTALLPHGIVFALFMVAIMIGSKLFELLIAAAAALAVPILSSDHTLQLAAFLVFEVCCGIYFPSAGTMRSKYIPEEVRSTVMNIYRVGLNALVVITLVNIESLAQDTVFLLTVFLLALAVVCQHRLFALVEANQSQEERTKAGLAPGEELDGALATKTDASA